ncbi:MAG: hypothetical protein RLZZ543_1321 [Bacteroidota bacterium]
MTKKLLLILLTLTPFLRVSGQVGGQNIYSFLNLPNSARVQALGGSAIAFRDDDVNMAYQNPGLISSSMASRASLTYVKYFAGINFGNAAYAFNVKKAGTVALSMQYIDYGTFDRADQTGEIIGHFSAGEYCFTAGFGRKIDSLFTVGVNVKSIFSSLDSYSSFGMALDFGASYKSPDKLFEASALIKNFGYQFNSYVDGNREALPFELQIGLSKKLKHVPLQFSFVGHNLEQPIMTYEDPLKPTESIDPLTGDTIINKIGVGNKILRHAILGAEFNITKGLAFRVGYNYQRRQEMKVDSRLGTVGISWGLGVKIYKFSLAYARSAYHLAGSPNQITLSAKLSEFYRKQ